MLPLRLVIDTNVLISAAIKPAGLQRTVLLLAITKPARLYVSRSILEEYSEVLARPELRIRKGPPPAITPDDQEAPHSNRMQGRSSYGMAR
jgi:predicted nucleic acid-binding protein